MSFGVQFQKLYGTAGEFRLQGPSGVVTACYVQTRIRAVLDGSWDSVLTSHMRPWRESFAVERMSFDELLQRDLDDSRVANDLIPYLMGMEASKYPVFPPILAVLAPKTAGEGTGIEKFYPPPTEASDPTSFGDVFKVGPYKTPDGAVTPIHELSYNPQRSTFVIVDGQHRAMALLALFRQLQGSSAWGSNPYATYYTHLQPKPEQVMHIQLPVCVLYFPQVYDGPGSEYEHTDADLVTICRQIFLDVNKQAKKVSRSRELLLDDSRFTSVLMRRALSDLRAETNDAKSARIHSFDFGRDFSSDQDRVVVTGGTQYSSSHALHVMAGALCFANPDVLAFDSSVDVTDGRYRRNPTRPSALLAEQTSRPIISVKHAARLHHAESGKITSSLFALWRDIVPGMFTSLAPYQAHNTALHALRLRLDQPQARANAPLNEARGLLFGGGGEHDVFQQHVDRLKKYLDEDGDAFGSFRSRGVIEDNLKHCKAVQEALDAQVRDFRTQRALLLWNVDDSRVAPDSDAAKEFTRLARHVFDAYSTQALQLGYAMAIATLADPFIADQQGAATYEQHKRVISGIATVLAAAVNSLFEDTQKKRTSPKKGPAASAKAHVFSSSSGGALRQLYNGYRTTELNEKAWRFFRFAFAEILTSNGARKAVIEAAKALDPDVVDAIRQGASSSHAAFQEARAYWESRYGSLFLKNSDFIEKRRVAEAAARADGMPDDKVRELAAKMDAEESTARIAEIQRKLDAALVGRSTMESLAEQL